MRRISLIALVVVAALAALAACGGSEPGAGGTLGLVAYSTPKAVYEDLIPRFQATPAGQGVELEQSYGSSGEQSRAVEAGLPADVVALALEPDVTRLIESGLVAPDWNAGPTRGMVSTSVVVFAVREGNPKDIETWDDLLRDDVEVVTPNPFTSGGAQWNLLAAYGAQLELGRTEEEAIEFLRRLLANVAVQDKSARESLQTFSGGKGDVLLAYENEAIFAQEKGEELDYVVPDQTILIENPIAVVATSENTAVAQAFVDFALSPAGQRVFGEKGYRPVDATVLAEFDFPQPPGLFGIADLGGWADARERFFDRGDGIVARINEELGVGTSAS
ncbi:MAG: sulfate ABC transporter substrate-binding protein [Thermoleophilia bacterium]